MKPLSLQPKFGFVKINLGRLAPIIFFVLILSHFAVVCPVSAQTRCYGTLTNAEIRKQKHEQEIMRKNRIRKVTTFTLVLDSADTNFYKTRVRMFDIKGRMIEDNDMRYVWVYTYNNDDLVKEEKVYDLDGNLQTHIETVYDKRKPLKKVITSQQMTGTVHFGYNSKGLLVEEISSGALFGGYSARYFQYNKMGAKVFEYHIETDPKTGKMDTVERQNWVYKSSGDGLSDTILVYSNQNKLSQTLINIYDKTCRLTEEYRHTPFISMHYWYDQDGLINTIEMKDNIKSNSMTYRSEHIRDFSGKLLKEYYPTRPNNEIGIELEYEYYTE